MSEERIQKINELIKRLVSEIILKELSFKEGVFVTISKVDTTPDLRYTRVFASIFPEKEAPYALKTLEKELFKIQGQLNKKLSMRPLPKIEWRNDPAEAKTAEIEKLLKDI